MSIVLQSLGVIMQLFPEVDKKQTIRNAKNFLKKQLPKMMIQARVSSLSLKSPVISDMPSGSSYVNSNESNYIYMLQRRRKVFYPYSKTVASYGLRNIDNGFVSTLQDSHAVWEVIGNVFEDKTTN